MRMKKKEKENEEDATRRGRGGRRQNTTMKKRGRRRRRVDVGSEARTIILHALVGHFPPFRHVGCFPTPPSLDFYLLRILKSRHPVSSKSAYLLLFVAQFATSLAFELSLAPAHTEFEICIFVNISSTRTFRAAFGLGSKWRHQALAPSRLCTNSQHLSLSNWI